MKRIFRTTLLSDAEAKENNTIINQIKQEFPPAPRASWFLNYYSWLHWFNNTRSDFTDTYPCGAEGAD